MKDSKLFYIVGVCIGLILTIVHVLGYRYVIISDELIRFLFFGYALVFTFIKYESKNKLVTIFWILLSAYASLYMLFEGSAAQFRFGLPTIHDTIAGSIAVIVTFEATRRAFGKSLPIIGAFLFVYALWLGQFMPRFLHIPTFDFGSIINLSYVGLHGIFGVALKVTVMYVFIFILFGNLLSMVGGAEFFMELSKCILKKTRGMYAKVAIVSSTLIGSVSGSAQANVMITGAITIPAMKKEGFPPEIAGAVEAVASTGGQLMPPVMAAVAFIMAEFLRVPYIVVCKYALVPILLYYFSVWLSVEHYTERYLDSTLDSSVENETNKERGLIELLKAKGFHLAPLLVLIVLLVLRFSPLIAIWWAMGATLLAGLISSETRKLINIPRILKMFEGLVTSCAPLIVASAIAGFILGIIGLTGMGVRLSSVIEAYSFGIPFLALILTAIIALIFGMGLPTTVCYILIVSLVAPGLIRFGIPEPVAHLYVLYYCIISMITPPMCMASFAAAALAQSDPMKTGWESIRLGFVMLFLPILFVYNPGLLLIGSIPEIVFAIFKGIIFVLCSIAIINKVGYIGFLHQEDAFVNIGQIERMLFIAVLALLVPSNLLFNGIAILMFAIIMIKSSLDYMKQRNIKVVGS